MGKPVQRLQPVLRVLRALLLGAVALLSAAPGWAQAQPAEDKPAKDRSAKDEPAKDESAKDKSLAAEPTKEELAAARALFRSAMADEKAGDWMSALEKVTKVSKVKMTPQVRYHLAFCHEHLGHLVEAINGFEVAEQEARAAGPKAKSVAINAPARAEKLRARVAHVTITVEGTLRTSQILIDDKAVSMALLDTDIPIDPGTHVLQVKRDGKVQYERTLELDEGAGEQIELEIDDPEPAPPKPKPVKPKPPPPDPTSPVPGWVIGAFGAAAIAVGGVMWVLREDTIETVRAGCEPGDVRCDPADIDTARLGKTYSIVSYVTWAAGGAALVTGIALIIALTPDDEPQEGAAAASGGSDSSAPEAAKEPAPVSLTIAPSLTGLHIFGRF